MKVIANHFLDPRIQISPHTGSDKSWIWNAYDFSDNELVERVRFILVYSINFLIVFLTDVCPSFWFTRDCKRI